MGATVFYWHKNMSIQSKNFEIKKYPLSLGIISGDFSVNNMKQTGLIGCMCDFSLIIVLLILVILSVSINIKRKNMI